MSCRHAPQPMFASLKGEPTLEDAARWLLLGLGRHTYWSCPKCGRWGYSGGYRKAHNQRRIRWMGDKRTVFHERADAWLAYLGDRAAVGVDQETIVV